MPSINHLLGNCPYCGITEVDRKGFCQTCGENTRKARVEDLEYANYTNTYKHYPAA